MVNARHRHLGLLIVAQLGCVGIGLWMQHRVVVSSLEHAARRQGWAGLAVEFDSLSSVLLGRRATIADVESHTVDSLRDLLATAPFALTDGSQSSPAVLVDDQWRVVAQRVPAQAPAIPSLSPGQLLQWTVLREPLKDVGAYIPGHLVMPDGMHLALAFPVQGGHLIVHRSLDRIRKSISAITATLPIAGFMALFWTCALLAITMYMIMARFHDQIERERADAESKALRRIQTLLRTQDAVIFGLAKLADSRDPETGDHLERISIYSSLLASALRNHPVYGKVVTPSFVRLIGISSALHDIGKVGIKDSILLKPGPLTAEERTQMQVHTTIGGECLREIERRLGRSNFLEMARETALSHHEWWDGTGYPEGLQGDRIPLAARIVAIADVYDALSTRRVYKEAFPHVECVDEIRNGAGTQFDPELIQVWLGLADQFRELAIRYAPPVRDASPGIDQQPVLERHEQVPAV